MAGTKPVPKSSTAMQCHGTHHTPIPAQLHTHEWWWKLPALPTTQTQAGEMDKELLPRTS